MKKKFFIIFSVYVILMLIACSNDNIAETTISVPEEPKDELESEEYKAELVTTSDESAANYTEENLEQSLEEYIFDNNKGPLTYENLGYTGFCVYQYDIETGEKNLVYQFDNKKIYNTTLPFDSITFIPNYHFKELFTEDMSKLAVSWYDVSDGSNRVGWIDKDGKLTDISEIIHPSTSDFSSVVMNDTSPIFTCDGQFMFADHNEEKYVYIDIENQNITKEEEIMRASLGRPYWAMIFYPNGEKNEILTDRQADYISIQIDEENTLYIHSALDWHRKRGEGIITAYDFIDNGKAVGIIDDNDKTWIGKYGQDITAPSDGNKYGYGTYIKLTPDSDYYIESCVYHDGKIAFIGERGSERYLFMINDGDEVQEVKQVCAIPKDEKLLFWK